MFYDELPLPPELRPVLRCIWRLQGAGASSPPATDRVVPDGCSEIIINRKSPFRRLVDGGGLREQDPILLVGQLKRALLLLPGEQVDLIGIRFQPTGAHAILGLPMHEITDRDVDLRALAPGLASELDSASRTDEPESLVQGLGRALLAERDRRRGALRSSPEVRAMLQAFDSGVGSSASASDLLRRSRRAIERDFREQVGLSPKSYQRIARLQRLLADIESGRRFPSLAALSLRHGFSDQPHLNREFRLLVGITPGAWLAERPELGQVFVRGDESHYYKTDAC